MPASPGEWLDAARGIYQQIIKALARYGVAPDPTLRLIEGDLPTPYYEPAKMTIGVGLPDPAQAQGRMYWLVVARMWGLGGVDEAMEATLTFLPWLMAHEVGHHLRHAYGAPNTNDFVEEQVANTIAVAMLHELPEFRAALPRLRDLATRAAQHLSGLSAATVPLLPGYRLNVGDVLVAQGSIRRERLDDLRLVAEVLGQPLEEILDTGDAVPDATLDAAGRSRSNAEAYFNRRYTSSLFEYLLFGNEWLRAYLEQTEFPSLGEVLESYILTSDWERTRRLETRLLLSAAMKHGAADLGRAAAEALADEAGSDALPELLQATRVGAPAVQAAALSALARLAPGDRAVASEAERLLHAEDAGVSAAAAEVLAQGRNPAVADARRALRSLLAGSPEAAEAALDVVARLGGSDFQADLVQLVTHAGDSGVRASGLRVLASGGPDADVARVAERSMADVDPEVRRAAVGCLAGRGSDAAMLMLAESLDDPAFVVRAEAAAALRSRGRDAIPALRGVHDSWRAMVEARLILSDLDGDVAAERALFNQLVHAIVGLRRGHESLTGRPGPQGLLADALAEEGRSLSILALRLAGALGRPEIMEIAVRGLAGDVPEAEDTAVDLAREAVPDALRPSLEEVVEGLVATPGASVSAGVSRGAPLEMPEIESASDPFLRELADLILRHDDVARSGQEAAMLTKVEKLMFLRSVPVFRAVSIKDLGALTEDVQVLRYPAGERIFDPGDPADALYVVTAGRVAIEQATPDGVTVRMAELLPGEHFGEAAIFAASTRTASAVAADDTTLLAVERGPFVRLGMGNPRVFLEVLKTIAARLQQADVDVG